jgi:hypothetical protein
MYGVEYAWNLVVFSMVMSFSLTTPLILPFGECNGRRGWEGGEETEREGGREGAERNGEWQLKGVRVKGSGERGSGAGSK